MNGLNQRNNCRRKLLSYDTVGSCTSRMAPWRINIDVETTVIDVTITFSRLTRRCLWLQSDAEDKLSEKLMIKSYENYFVTSLLCYASDREPIKIDSCLTEMKKSLLINANNSLIEIETESIFKIDLELIKIAYIIV